MRGSPEYVSCTDATNKSDETLHSTTMTQLNPLCVADNLTVKEEVQQHGFSEDDEIMSVEGNFEGNSNILNFKLMISKQETRCPY